MTTGPAQRGVLIADDDRVLRYGLCAIINAQSDMAVVAEAGTVKDAVEAFAKHKPDLLLMDLCLEGESGLSAIRQIISCTPAARILALSTYEWDHDNSIALAEGALGYVVKGMSHEDLLRAMRAALAGRRLHFSHSPRSSCRLASDIRS